MVTTDAAHQFWIRAERSPYDTYEELARAYEENIEISHPSGASCICGNSCPWAATKVTYPTYTGPSIETIK